MNNFDQDLTDLKNQSFIFGIFFLFMLNIFYLSMKINGLV